MPPIPRRTVTGQPAATCSKLLTQAGISTASADRHRKSASLPPSSRDLATARGVAVLPSRDEAHLPHRRAAAPSDPRDRSMAPGGLAPDTVNTGAIHRQRWSTCGHLRKFVCIELNDVGNRQKQGCRTVGELGPIRGENDGGRRASWPDDSRLRGPATVPTGSLGGGRPASGFKIYRDGVQPGAWPRYRLLCVRSRSLEARPRLAPTRENSSRMGALRVRVLGLGKTWAVFNFIQTPSGRKHKLAAIRAAIARRPDYV
jgi:hypothetical protein